MVVTTVGIVANCVGKIVVEFSDSCVSKPKHAISQYGQLKNDVVRAFEVQDIDILFIVCYLGWKQVSFVFQFGI